MAEIKLAKAAERIQWAKEFQKEYTADSPYRPFMGTGSSMPIRVHKDLTKQAGDTLRIDYFRRLIGDGVTGGTKLEGNEEAMRNLVCEIRATYFRHATAVGKNEAFKTDVDLANVARDQLKEWSTMKFDNDIRAAFGQVVIKGAEDGQGSFLPDTYVNFNAATASQKNSWLANNADRIMFGAKKGVDAGASVDTAIGNMAAGETLSAPMISKAKNLARTAVNYRVRPTRHDTVKGTEVFTLMVGADAYNSIFADGAVYEANKDARTRGLEDHPLFKAGDLWWQGVLVREDPLLPAGQSYLVGAEAVAVGYAQYATPVVERFDYGRLHGIGIEEIRGQNKFSVEGKQTGIVTIFHK